MLKGDTDKGSWENYLDHIGLFFIFTACAGISIIVWIFNWICWLAAVAIFCIILLIKELHGG